MPLNKFLASWVLHSDVGFGSYWVIIPLHTQHYVLPQRSLIYIFIIRAESRECTVPFGERLLECGSYRSLGSPQPGCLRFSSAQCRFSKRQKTVAGGDDFS